MRILLQIGERRWIMKECRNPSACSIGHNGSREVLRETLVTIISHARIVAQAVKGQVRLEIQSPCHELLSHCRHVRFV
jgi:hypothetical protein